MYFSLTIGGANTYNRWHLIPTSRPVINPPTFKKNTIDLPGANGILDLSTALTGYPLYDNRTGSIEFLVEPDHEETWQYIYTDIMESVHGKDLVTTMEEDPGWYYDGRWTVNQWKSDKRYSLITLDYDLKPYKRRQWGVRADWLWDPFDFLNGIVTLRDYGDFFAFGKAIDSNSFGINSGFLDGSEFSEKDLREILGSEPKVPTITVTGGEVTVRFVNGDLGIYDERTLGAGSYIVSDWVITPVSTLKIEAIGHATLDMFFTPGRM